MATYQLADRGPGVPFGAPGYAPFRFHLNVPNIIAYGGLQTTAGAVTSLASTGFAGSDILRVFNIPAGFEVRGSGVRVTTAEGSVCTGDLGCNSATQTHLLTADADGIQGTLDLNITTTQINLIADVQLGGSTYEGLVFITNGTVDLTINNTCAAVVADLWLGGWQCW